MPIKNTTPKPVAPDSVRIWRGFRNKALSSEKFFADLGSVFVPATVELQWPSGLDAYIPSFPAGKGKPDTVPDETAILFWDSQLAYKNGFDTLAIRTYTMTHASVYNTKNKMSTTDFPKPLAKKLKADTCYYFFNQSIDWMQGSVFHLAGGRPANTTPAQFLAGITSWANEFQANNPDKATGAIICVSKDYVVFWECIPKAKNSGAGMQGLTKLCSVYHNQMAQPVTLPAGLFDNYMGMDVKPGDSYNMQFQRRNVTD